MEATVKSKKGKKATSTKKRASPTGKAQTQSQPQSFQEDEMMPEESRYVGCFASESSFVDSIYDGGSTGANYGLALHHAKTSGKRYFAIARAGADGHSFSFSKLKDSPQGNIKGGGCERPCADQETKPCGCMDFACTGDTPPGEEHNRRWAVYEVL